jgi:flagellar biosynthesis regulator FlbT
MRQYRGMQDFFDYHLFHNPELPNTRMEEVKALVKKGDLLSNMRAMTLVREGLIRHKVADYNTLMYASTLTRIFGNFDEAIVLSEMALKNHYIDQEALALRDNKAFRAQIEADKARLQTPQQIESRQVRRAKEREMSKR